jgi:hypothetical protein
MLVPLLGYFLCMITVLAGAAGALVGLFDTSTSDRAHHYPRPVVERNITIATNTERRLFMSVPDTKDASPTKNTEASSAVASDAKVEAKTSKPHKPKMVARQESRGYGSAQGYAQETQYGPQRLFSNW